MDAKTQTSTASEMSEIERLYNDFQDYLETRPGNDIPGILIELEGKIKAIIEERDYLSERYPEKRDTIERKMMHKITGDSVNIGNLLEILAQKVQEILKKSPEEIDREMGIFVKELSGVVLPPGAGNRQEGDGNSESKEEKELTESRYGKILEILRENEIYADDIIVYKGQLRTSQMRQTSYRVIQIPRLSKTIFVCDEYGEASFVVDSLVYPEVFLEHTKSDIREKLSATRIIHSLAWETRLSEALFGTPEERKARSASEKTLTTKIDVRKMEEYRQEILRQFPTPEVFMNRSTKEKWGELIPGVSSLRMYGIIFGRKIRKNVSAKEYGELARFFYGSGYEIIDCEFWDNDTWVEKIKVKYPNGEQFMRDRKIFLEFSILGRYLTFFHSKFLGYKGSPVGNPVDRGNLLKYIYGDNDAFNVSNFSKDFFIGKIKEQFPHPNLILVIPFHKNGQKRKIKSEITISGIGIQRIANEYFGLTGNVLESNQTLARFLILIYGKGYKELDSYFWGFDEWKREIIEQYPEKNMLEKIPVSDFRKKKIIGRSFCDISNTFLGTNYNLMNRGNIEIFLNKIYG